MHPAIAALTEGFLARNPVPGMALAVSQNGEVTHEWSHGFRNREGLLPAMSRSRFGIASVTKVFTAIAILQLQDAGRLLVSDPVLRYLPELRIPNVEQVTLHHLLSHTSGLPALGTEPYAAASTDPDMPALPPLGRAGRTHIDSVDELIQLLGELDIEPVGLPGARMCYSNDGFALLGLIVERVSGMEFAAYVRERISVPLGLGETCFGPVGKAGGGTRRYYQAPSGRQMITLPVADSRSAMALIGAGGGPQLSNPQNLLRLMEIFRCNGLVDGRRLLSKAAVEQMLTPHATVSPGTWYGYGLYLWQAPDGGLLAGHNGGDVGVAASVLLSLTDGVGVAIQANLGATVGHLAQQIMNSLRGTAGEVPAEPVLAAR